MSMEERLKEIEEAPTTEHELYVSVGLLEPMKPSEFRNLIDSLMNEHIYSMQSWGVHTEAEYIGIIDEQVGAIKRLTEEITEYEQREERNVQLLRNAVQERDDLKVMAKNYKAVANHFADEAKRLTEELVQTIQMGTPRGMLVIEQDEKEKPPVCCGCGYPNKECKCAGH